jgi:radical SAM superfamily enzyme YgiQ (UPF0313 family)
MKTKVLMVYPKVPPTFWNYDYVVRYLGKKASFPPLGLLTIAALLPDNYEVRLVDMNAYELSRDDVMWADMVFISAMNIQLVSFNEVVDLCYQCKKRVVVGGPIIFSSYEIGPLPLDKIDHLFSGEAEITLPQFLKDYEEGHPKKIYQSDIKPDISKNPIPRYDLINPNDYWYLSLQYSRGCPFNCDFCDISALNGRQVRTKTTEQVLNELEVLYRTGFEGGVFFVDENLIGNIAQTKEMLRKLVEWHREKAYPFIFLAQTSLNLASDDELLDLMSNAGFGNIFLGVESPNPDTLADVKKNQNLREDLLTSIRRIQAKGMVVLGGFIVGFDTDTEAIFDQQIEFIQRAGIPIVMVGLLVAMPHTPLYERLKKENRLIDSGWHTGDNVDLFLNFIPKMPEKTLIEGYKRVLSYLYEPKNFYDRFLTLLENMPKESPVKMRLIRENIPFMQKVLDVQSSFAMILKEIFSSHGLEYIRFINRVRKLRTVYFWVAVGYAANGRHYFDITKKVCAASYVYRQPAPENAP